MFAAKSNCYALNKEQVWFYVHSIINVFDFFLQATGDPYYLEVGKNIVDKINEHARVPCGFAALKDVRTLTHEDR